MKEREVDTQAGRDAEFLGALQTLHDEGDALPTMTSIQEQILRERAAARSSCLRLLYQAGVRLYMIDISEEARATRQRLENKGLVESAPEARVLAAMDDRPPALLVWIPPAPLTEAA
jgi:hypothetical protein